MISQQVYYKWKFKLCGGILNDVTNLRGGKGDDVQRAKGYRGLVDSGGRSLKKVYLCDVICDVPQEYSSDPNKDPTP